MTTHLPRLLILVLLFFAESRTAVAAEPHAAASSVVALDGRWMLAVDPKNVGRDQKWWEKPTAEAKATKVPWIIQEVFPGYHGVAWYWRDFTPPANPHAEGRYLLRFWQVDYLADVWLNGVHVGQHEGGEDPFVLDVTDGDQAAGRQPDRRARAQPNATKPIDGIVLARNAAAQQDLSVHAGQRLQLRRHHRFGRIAGRAGGARRGSVRAARSQDRPDPRPGQSPQRGQAGRSKAAIDVHRRAGHQRRDSERRPTRSRAAARRHADRDRADGGPSPALGAQRSVPVSRDGPGERRVGRVVRRADRPAAGSAISASKTAIFASTAGGSS